MKTIKLSVFSSFSEYTESGISYSLVDKAMKDYYINSCSESEKYLCDVEIPHTPHDEVIKMATNVLEKEITDLQVQITMKKEKIKQLLCIDHKGGEA